jgi:beta-lactamase class A
MPSSTLIALTTLALCAVSYAAAPATRPASIENYVLDYTTPVDPALQSKVERIDTDLRKKYDIAPDLTNVGLLDLTPPGPPRLAMIHPDHEEYAASVAKIGILLAYFTVHPEAATHLDPTTRQELGMMAKISSNEMASKFSHELTLAKIQDILNQDGFYDASHGGGLWVGKHYGRDKERHGSPVADNSHAITVRQAIRFWLLLDQDKLVSPAASQTMKQIFATPDLPPDDIKFVHALKDREGMQILRKWGTWENWLHDTALITAPGRHYILVALTRHPKGDDYLVGLAKQVDDLMQQPR